MGFGPHRGPDLWPHAGSVTARHLPDLGRIRVGALRLSVVPVHIVAAPPGHADPAESAVERRRRCGRPDRAGPPPVDLRRKATLNTFDITSDGGPLGSSQGDQRPRHGC
jgi:hypothetical protein